MDTVQVGKCGLYFLKYKLAKNEISFCLPEEQSKALDILITSKSGNFYRCEIKTKANERSFFLGYTKKGKKILYTKQDKIDFFFLVDITNEKIAVVPFSEIEGKKYITITTKSFVAKYIDKFNLLG